MAENQWVCVRAPSQPHSSVNFWLCLMVTDGEAEKRKIERERDVTKVIDWNRSCGTFKRPAVWLHCGLLAPQSRNDSQKNREQAKNPAQYTVVNVHVLISPYGSVAFGWAHTARHVHLLLAPRFKVRQEQFCFAAAL